MAMNTSRDFDYILKRAELIIDELKKAFPILYYLLNDGSIIVGSLLWRIVIYAKLPKTPREIADQIIDDIAEQNSDIDIFAPTSTIQILPCYYTSYRKTGTYWCNYKMINLEKKELISKLKEKLATDISIADLDELQLNLKKIETPPSVTSADLHIEAWVTEHPIIIDKGPEPAKCEGCGSYYKNEHMTNSNCNHDKCTYYNCKIANHIKTTMDTYRVNRCKLPSCHIGGSGSRGGGSYRTKGGSYRTKGGSESTSSATSDEPCSICDNKKIIMFQIHFVEGDTATVLGNYTPYFIHESLAYSNLGFMSRSVPLRDVVNSVINNKTAIYNTTELVPFLQNRKDNFIYFTDRLLKTVKQNFTLEFSSADLNDRHLIKHITDTHATSIANLSFKIQDDICKNALDIDIKPKQLTAAQIQFIYMTFLESSINNSIGSCLLPPLVKIIAEYAARSNEKAYHIDYNNRRRLAEKYQEIDGLTDEINLLDTNDEMQLDYYAQLVRIRGELTDALNQTIEKNRNYEQNYLEPPSSDSDDDSDVYPNNDHSDDESA